MANIKTEKCKVLMFTKSEKALTIDFKGYGIRIENIEDNYEGIEYVDVLYKGEIGKPNFTYKIK